MESRIEFKAWMLFSAVLLLLPAVEADVLDTIGGINNLLYGVAAGIAALMITLHAIRWKTASSPAERQDAKKGMVNVILGLIIIMLALTIVGLIYTSNLSSGLGCDQLDGWYTMKALGPTCIGGALCTDTVERTEKDYSESGGVCDCVDKTTKTECAVPLKNCAAGESCSAGICSSPGNPLNCDLLDGWYTTKLVGLTCIGDKQCLDTVEKTERDYFIFGATCSYAAKSTRTECASGLKDCPAGKNCVNGFCGEVGTTTTPTTATTRRPTTTRKPTTTSTSSTTTSTGTPTTTTQPGVDLTAKNLVDCINSKNGELYTWYKTAQYCQPCIDEAENVFGKDNFPDGTGTSQYNRLKKFNSGSPSGYYPCWNLPGKKYNIGCMTLDELNKYFDCKLTKIPGHAYYCCDGTSSVDLC